MNYYILFTTKKARLRPHVHQHTRGGGLKSSHAAAVVVMTMWRLWPGSHVHHHTRGGGLKSSHTRRHAHHHHTRGGGGATDYSSRNQLYQTKGTTITSFMKSQ